MKHAVCIMGYGNSDIAQETITFLDDPDIDFYVHWDSKYELPSFYSKFSKIKYLKDRVDVKWGQFTEILAEVNLMKAVKDSNKNYDYVHLISSNDIPLMDKSYFKNFFNREVYIGFQYPLPKNVVKRVSYYYPISFIDVKKHLWIIKLIKVLNYIFRVNRLKKKNINIKKGPNWFSMRYRYIDKVLSSNLNIFKHGYLVDEVFMQTIFCDLDPKSEVDDNLQAARYIIWHGVKNPHPAIIKQTDVDRLKELVNTKYAFARKVTDPSILKSIFS